MNTPQSTRFSIRINRNLYEWVKQYAQRMHTTASALVKDHLESLQHSQAEPPVTVPTVDAHADAQLEPADCEIQRLTEMLAEKGSEIQRLHKQLESRDEQLESALRSLDHAQQLLAVQTKTNAALTDRLQAIEDLRNRPWWKRLFGR